VNRWWGFGVVLLVAYAAPVLAQRGGGGYMGAGRRREPVPEAKATGGLPAPLSRTAAVRLIAPEFNTNGVTKLPGLLAARLI